MGSSQTSSENANFTGEPHGAAVIIRPVEIDLS